MSSESERTERLIDIVRTAGLLSANILPIIDRLRGPDCHRQADRADGPGLRLRLKHWDREIQRLWSMIPLELPELAQRLKHIGKPGPWAPDDRSIDWGGAADEWRSVEVEARRRLALGKVQSKTEQAGHRSRRRRTAATRKLTGLQLQAVELFSRHEGRLADVAREMGVTHQTVGKHLRAAWRKVPAFAPITKPKRGRTARLPSDHRGQTAL